MAQTIPQGTFQDAFAITASDTVNISGDAGNTKGYKTVFLHNIAAGATCRVLPADSDTPVTIWLPQGITSTLAVKQVFATTPTPPAGLLGFISKQ